MTFATPFRTLMASMYRNLFAAKYTSSPDFALLFKSGSWDRRVTHSRTTGATMVHSDGVTDWGPENLILWSSDLTNGAWTAMNVTRTYSAGTAPDGTNTACRVVNTPGELSYLAPTATLAYSTTYTKTIYCEIASGNTAPVFVSTVNKGAGEVATEFNLSTLAVSGADAATSSIEDEGDGWYRLRHVFTTGASGSLSAGVFYLGQYGWTPLNAAFLVWGARLQRGTHSYADDDWRVQTTSAAVYAARLRYDPLTLACAGFLYEKQATNRCLYSEDLSNGVWSKRGTCAVVANDTTAPDGTLTADKLTFAGFSTGDIYQIGPTVTVSAAASPSFYIKKQTASGTFTVQTAAGPATGEWTVDLALIGSGWERLTSTHPAVTVVTPFVGTGTSSDGLNIFQAAGSTVVVWLWGVQIEQASTASSYIPTAGASATRAADVAYVDVPTYLPWLSMKNATFYAEVQLQAYVSYARILGTNTGETSLFVRASASQLGGFDGATEVIASGPSMLAAAQKVAASLGAGSRSIAIGGTTASDASNAHTPPTRIYIGSNNGAADFLSGTFVEIRIYSHIKPAAEMAQLTA